MNWKVVLVVFWATAFSLNVQAQEEDHPYQAFRTGTFVYDNADNVEVIRTKKKQTTEVDNGARKMVSDIEWMNDSTYVLTVKRIVNYPGCLEVGDQILVQVTGVDGDRFYFEAISKKCGNANGAMRKLR